MQIPFVNLAKQFSSIENELVQNFIDIGRSGGYIMGEVLETFEKNAATYLEVKHVLGVADGSDALFLIMHALGIGEGDEVITAPNSFIATVGSSVHLGARPVFVDVLPDQNMNPDLIQNVITKKTK